MSSPGSDKIQGIIAEIAPEYAQEFRVFADADAARASTAPSALGASAVGRLVVGALVASVVIGVAGYLGFG